MKTGIVPSILDLTNPIIEEGQNTYYEEERGLFTKAKNDGNNSIISNKSKNEFGSDVAIMFNPQKMFISWEPNLIFKLLKMEA